MKNAVKGFLCAGACALATLAMSAPTSAEPWVDYSPAKGFWQVTTVKVEPSKIDDYLTGLRKGWVKGEEMAKKHGIIDDYFVMVRVNDATGDGNVMMGEHYTSFSKFDPDKARDMAMKKAMEPIMSEKASKAQVAGYNKYRKFVGESMWVPVNFAK